MKFSTKIIRSLNETADHRPIRFHQAFIRGTFDGDIQIAALSCPRGNAKSWLFGQLMAQALIPGSPLYTRGFEDLCVAGSLDQARVMVQFMRQVLEPKGDEWVFVDSSQRLQVKHTATNTRVRVLSSSAKRALGIANFRRIYCDEPGSWEARNGELLWSALTTSLGKVPGQSVLIAGTIAPASPESWWPEHLEGGNGPGRYVQVVQADPSEPWDQWRTIQRANPMVWHNAALRRTILRERDEARKLDKKRPTFEAFRLNRLVDVINDPLVQVDDWKAVERRPVPPRKGRPIVGWDSGAERSWSAAWCLWPNGRSECYALAPGIPSLQVRERQDAQPRGLYVGLHAVGNLLVDVGRRVSRPEVLVKHLRRKGINPRVVYCDRFQLGALRDAAPWPIQPRITRWSESTEDIGAFWRLVKDGPFSVDKPSRPLARLGMGQAVVERDSSGNCRLKKKRSVRSRDDVAVAGVLASGGLERYWRRPRLKWRFTTG